MTFRMQCGATLVRRFAAAARSAGPTDNTMTHGTHNEHSRQHDARHARTQTAWPRHVRRAALEGRATSTRSTWRRCSTRTSRSWRIRHCPARAAAVRCTAWQHSRRKHRSALDQCRCRARYAGACAAYCVACAAAPRTGVHEQRCSIQRAHVACHVARCTWHAAQCMPRGTLQVACHVARCMPDGTWHARWHVACHVARCRCSIRCSIGAQRSSEPPVARA